MATIGDMRGVRVSHARWDAHARIVGNAGRSADLRRYMEWRIDNPHRSLGVDPGADHGPVRKLRVDDALWKLYVDVVERGDCSGDLRTYIAWRLAHPDTPLPGQLRVTPNRFRERAT